MNLLGLNIIKKTKKVVYHSIQIFLIWWPTHGKMSFLTPSHPPHLHACTLVHVQFTVWKQQVCDWLVKEQQCRAVCSASYCFFSSRSTGKTKIKRRNCYLKGVSHELRSECCYTSIESFRSGQPRIKIFKFIKGVTLQFTKNRLSLTCFMIPILSRQYWKPEKKKQRIP